jgi:cadmium resistance protein CadD (predicted permease)
VGRFLDIAPLAIGVKGLLALRKPRADEPARARSAVGVLQIAAVTFANGGDDIAVYAPLFARRAWPSIVAILVVFGVMVAVWCACAHRLRRLPGLAPVLDRYCHRIAPVVLLGLGIYVFVAEGTAAYVLSAWIR